MYNKISFYLTKKIKKFQANRTTKRDLLSSLFILAGFFLLFSVSQKDKEVPVGLASSEIQTENSTKKISFVGDVMLGRFMNNTYEKEGIEGIFAHAKQDWAESDTVIANLENSVVHNVDDTESYNIDKSRINLAIDEEVMQGLAKSSGIDLFNLANNHMADYGAKGILETLEIMQKNDINQVGLYDNYTQIDEMYSVINVNDKKIAMVSFSDVIPVGRGLGVGENTPGVILPTTQQSLLLGRVMERAKRETDLVFVYGHWGEEYNYEPSTRQKELAQRLVDYGADLVIGAHPHVIQPVELIDGVPVVYSLGNFVFDQAQGSTVSSVIMHVQTDGESIDQLEFLPYKIVNGIPRPEESKLARRVTYRKLTKQLEELNVDHSNYEKIQIKLEEK